MELSDDPQSEVELFEPLKQFARPQMTTVPSLELLVTKDG